MGRDESAEAVSEDLDIIHGSSFVDEWNMLPSIDGVPMDPVLQAVLTKLATSAAGKVLRELTKDGPVDKAIRRVADDFRDTYEGLDSLVRDFLKRDDVEDVATDLLTSVLVTRPAVAPELTDNDATGRRNI